MFDRSEDQNPPWLRSPWGQRTRRHLASIILVTAAVSTLTVVSSPGLPMAAEEAAASSAVGGRIYRSEVLKRAQHWYDKRQSMAYDDNRHDLDPDIDGHHRYGQDCSGLVAMAWHVQPGRWGGPNTTGLASSRLTTQIRLTDLRPGDALVRPGVHANLFVGWHADRRHFTYYNFGRYPMRRLTGTFVNGRLLGATYQARRYRNIVDDPATPKPPAPGPAGRLYRATTLGDVTRDGVADVVAIEPARNAGQLWLYPGGRAGLGARRPLGRGGWNGIGEITSLGDLGSDGLFDLAAVEKSTGRLWRYQLSASGAHGARVLIGAGWNGMGELAGVGDATGDGHPDLLAVEKSTGRLYLYSGNATGGLGSRTLIGRSGWNGIGEIAAAGDATGDKHPDLLAVEKSTGRLYLYTGNAAGGLSARTLIGRSGWNSMRSLSANLDLTGDSVKDLLAIENGSGRMWLYPGTGAGHLGARRLVGSGWNG